MEGPLVERIFKIAAGVNACSKRLEDSKNRIEDDAIEANSTDPVNEILAPNGYRCIDVDFESEYPGDLEKAFAGSKFLEDLETEVEDDAFAADSEDLVSEIETGSGDIDDWELVPDLCGDVPARLPQSDSAWRDYDWRQKDILPSKADLNILLAGKLVDDGDLAGGIFGLGGEERPG